MCVWEGGGGAREKSYTHSCCLSDRPVCMYSDMLSAVADYSKHVWTRQPYAGTAAELERCTLVL